MAYSKPSAYLVDNKESPAFLNLTHDFGRYGLALEADWSEIPIRSTVRRHPDV
jgi:hypothetical protein